MISNNIVCNPREGGREGEKLKNTNGDCTSKVCGVGGQGGGSLREQGQEGYRRWEKKGREVGSLR